MMVRRNAVFADKSVHSEVIEIFCKRTSLVFRRSETISAARENHYSGFSSFFRCREILQHWFFIARSGSFIPQF